MFQQQLYIGIPRERFYMNEFVDNRDFVVQYHAERGYLAGVYQVEGHRVDRNRDKIVQQFLNHPKRPQYLLMLDSDMTFPINCGERLMTLNKDIVGGLYFHRGRDNVPIAFRKAEVSPDEWGRLVQMWQPLNDEVYKFLMRYGVGTISSIYVKQAADKNGTVIEVDGLGTGCMMIRRDVLENMPSPWFEYSEPGQSEDLQFCDQAISRGYHVYLDLATICSHMITSHIGPKTFIQSFEEGAITSSFNLKKVIEQYKQYAGVDLDKVDIAKHQQFLSEMWSEADKSAAGVIKYYKDRRVGLSYVPDLVNWNNSAFFNYIRRKLKGIRNQRVLEIGGGIGTVALQLAIQENEVHVVEPNSHLRKFIKIRYHDLVANLMSGSLGELTAIDLGHLYMPGPPVIGDYDLVIGIDTFEHIHPNVIANLLLRISRLMKVGGKLFFHNNFKQQDLYPMHYNHGDIWEDILKRAKFVQIDPYWAVKYE